MIKVMKRINELKSEGRWSFRQPKKVRGPALYKAHWDYLLDEMVSPLSLVLFTILNSQL